MRSQRSARPGNRRAKQHIEIMPAAMLPRKREWQGVAGSLPAGACLLVTDPENARQTKFMCELARSFREKGRLVFIYQPVPSRQRAEGHSG